MKRYVFATMLFASIVVSLPSAAQQSSIWVGGKVCPDGQILVKGTCVAKCSKKTEYLAGLVQGCKACPANATCDGVNATCNSGYVNTAKSIHEIICERSSQACSKTQYMVNGRCVDCPKYGKCDGKNVKCPDGYTKDAKGYVTCKTVPTCESNQRLVNNKCVEQTCNSSHYLVNNKCVACPMYAKCDGKNVKCPDGYTKDAKGYVTCKAKLCKKGSHDSIAFIKKNYKNCTKCGTENIAAGKCAKNKKAHKHYHCMCNC